MNFPINPLSTPLLWITLLCTSMSVLRAQDQTIYVARSQIFGGSGIDAGLAIERTPDGSGLFLAGRSTSSDGNLTGNFGGSDYWVMRASMEGEVQWSNYFGGSNSEQVNALLPQSDGSVFAFGTTFSDIPELEELNGLFGAWLVRANAAGQMMFSKLISSNISEKGIDLVQTGETQITLLGETASDTLGGEMNHGITDYFLRRMTVSGIDVWTRLYGGNSIDEPAAMINTNDAGSIIAGSSMSGGGDLDTNRGGFDVWILKLLPNGELDWSRTYGGSGQDKASDIYQLEDGSYLVVGQTTSEDGDVSQPSIGEEDLWILKLDSEGTLLWERRYGGSGRDIGTGITAFLNGAFIVVGTTNSMDGDLTGNKGEEDTWMLYLDENGNVINKMNYGGSAEDFSEAVVADSSSVYILGWSPSTDGTLPLPPLPQENMWLLTMSTDSFMCSENLVCRQDTLNSSNIVFSESDSGIDCINGCTIGLPAGPAFIQSECTNFVHETAFIMIRTDENADYMTLSVDAEGFNLPYLALATSQGCTIFETIDCAFGYNGQVLIENIPVDPNTLYTAIVSDAEGNVGDFDLCVSVIDVEFCNVESSLYATETSLGSPLEGPYLPGEEVTFCYEITEWEKLECNGLQGIVPSFGIGWDSISLEANGEPVQVDTPLVANHSGTWEWYDLGEIRYNTFNPVNGIEGGQGMPAGWYFFNTDSPPPNADPNETEGDIALCTPSDDTWKVCFTMKTRSECMGNMDCSVTIDTYADGEVGANVSLACGYDPSIVLSAELNCCINPNIEDIPDLLRCTGDTLLFPIRTNIAGDVTYSWRVLSADLGILGASDGNSSVFFQILENIETFDQSVTYEISASAPFCEATPEVFTVTVRPRPMTNMQLVGPDQVCSGDPIELQFTNTGLPPYFAALAQNGSIRDTLLMESEVTSFFVTPEINTLYAVVGFSDQNCIGTAAGVAQVEVLPNPEVSIDQLICAGDTFFIGGLPFAEPGNFSVTIENGTVNGCDSTVNLTLGVAPVEMSVLDTFICAGEQLILGTDTLTETGAYEVFLTGQLGCDSIVSVTLAVSDTNRFEMSQTICPGNSVIFNGVAISEAGIYTDTNFISGQCISVDILNLEVLPEIRIDSLEIVSDNGNGTGAVFLDISGGTPPFTYQWSTGATTGSITDLMAGNYQVTITDDAGCSRAFTFNVPLSTATPDQTRLSRQIRIFPNPASSSQAVFLQYTGESNSPPVSVSLQNMVGQQLVNLDPVRTGATVQFETAAFEPGIYLVRIRQDHLTVYHKIIIQ